MSRFPVTVMLVATLLCLFFIPSVTSDDASSLYQQALDFYYQEKFENALDYCENALKLDPKSSSSWNLKGMILEDLGRYQDAIDAYDEAIALKPTNHVAYTNKGNALKHLVRYEEALQAYDQSLKVNPSYAYTYLNKGNLLSMMERYDDAIRTLESAISHNPQYSQAWYSMGLVYQKKNSHEDAVSCFEKAIQENPAYKEAYYAKGISLEKLGRTDAAIANFSQVLELDPQDASAKNQLTQLINQNSTSGIENTSSARMTGVKPGVIILIILLIAAVLSGVLFLRHRRSRSHTNPSPPSPETASLRGVNDDDTFRKPQTNGPHDVFISYSSLDKTIADAICANLEIRKIRCWIAPRDLLPGLMYQEGIIRAIENSRCMVFIFSSHSNSSPHIIRELTKAVSSGVIIIPFRIEEVTPSKSMEYLIGAPHWLDALTPPLEAHIKKLADTIESLLASEGEENTEKEKRI